MAKDKDNPQALTEQEALLDAIKENEVCVSITSGSAIGATLLAFNQTARKHNRKEMGAQEWAELAIATGLLAMKRAWEYSAETKNSRFYVDEMKNIAKLFTVPEPTQPKFLERMTARYEAEQACRAKYGIQ
jgi:hypothetical protein